jgi:hypothetical protein
MEVMNVYSSERIRIYIYAAILLSLGMIFASVEASQALLLIAIDKGWYLNVTDPTWIVPALLVTGSLVYFVPVFVAARKKPRSLSGIFVLNLFLAWTFVGWVAALVWAVTPAPAISVEA